MNNIIYLKIIKIIIVFIPIIIIIGSKIYVKWRIKNDPNLDENIVKSLLIANEIKEKTKTNYYKIETEKSDNLSLFDSKFGGIPYWNFNEEYPKNEKGENLILLAQINFDDIKNDKRLPDKGILQFFISNDDFYGMDYYGDKSDKQINWRVVYHKNINDSIKEKDIRDKGIKSMNEIEDEEGMVLNGTYKLSFKKSENGMESMNDYEFPKLATKVLKETYKIDVEDSKVRDYLNDLDDDFVFKFETWGEVAGNHRILGYPMILHYDVRENSRHGYEKYDTLLFQMDSEKEGIMWGDGGIAQFFINEQDLLNKDFSKVLYDWQQL